MNHLLIVDDKPENLYLLRALLHGHGYTVDEANNGAEALVKARQTPPQLIISDLLMPVMDGYTLLRQWKADKRLKVIPFVVYTATYTDPKDERLALDLGADAFIIKPVGSEPFLARIREVLSKEARGELSPTHAPQVEESVLLKEYSEVLVHKLEEKVLHLDQTNRALLAEIHEREETGAALRASETRYRTLFEYAPDGIFIANPESYYIDANASICQMLGYLREEMVGLHASDIVAREEIQHIGKAISAIRARVDYHREWQFRRKDGSVFVAEVMATLMPDGNLLAIVRDITERIQAEQVRAERVRLALLGGDIGMALIMSESLSGILRLCTEAVVRHLDAAFARIWTLSVDERVLELQASAGMYTHLDGPHGKVLVGQLEIGLIAQERRPYFTNAVVGDARVGNQEWARREGMVAFAGYPLLIDSRLVGVLALFARQPLNDTILQALSAVADQIALGIERKRTEQALHLRDRAIQAVTQGILITDPSQQDNPTVFASPGFLQMTSYETVEVLGRNSRFLQGKDTDPGAVARVREAVQTGKPCTVELLNYRKDGTAFWNELSISPVRDAAGRLTHFVGVQADVTSRRTLEEQFRQVQKMEAVGRLAGGVAHDFNNLLTIINGYSDLLLQKLSPVDPSRDLIAEIQKAGERSAGLTRQLLAFSRQQILAPRVLALNEVVAEAEKMFLRLIGEDVRLANTLGPELWAVRADPGQIEQVLMNLAVNARDAMPIGGQMTIETRNVELDETYIRTHPDARAGQYVLLSVTDTGSGMPREVQERIFEPFFTTKGVGKGTGLGLATVFGIVKQSGGHVTVYSEVGVGTTFEVYLPRAEQAAAEAKVLAGSQVPPRGTETILLVEDEAGVRALTRYILVECGYTVLEAAEGNEALEVAANHSGRIHLLVTDVVMPGVAGRVVAEQLTKRYPGVRVLFVSGYTADTVIRHGVLREEVNFLQKPFSPVALAFKVREVLDGR